MSTERRRLTKFIDTNFPTKVDPLEVDHQELVYRLSNLSVRHQLLLERANSEVLQEKLANYFYKNVQERWLLYLLNENYHPEYVFSKDDDKVFFDLETLYLPNDPEVLEQTFYNSTNYISKQRLGIAVTIDSKGGVKAWDEEGLVELIDYLIGFGEIVSYNGLKFDNVVLGGYKVDRNKIQELYNKSFDLLAFLQMVTGSRRKLDSVAKDLIGVGKYKDGNLQSSKNVPKILRDGNDELVKSAWKYTLKDVELLLHIYRKLYINSGLKLDFWSWQLDRIEAFLKEHNPNNIEDFYDPL
ncbi:MAG TPA: ribonuclease H-like domain-containing protein [Patescibacteria group bacterium]